MWDGQTVLRLLFAAFVVGLFLGVLNGYLIGFDVGWGKCLRKGQGKS